MLHSRTIVTAGLALLLAGLLLGCPPTFDEFQVGEGIGPPAGDAGPRTRAEPDLGEPCGASHLAVTIDSLTSDGQSQLRRFKLPELTECRETELAREHAAFGPDLYAVGAMPDGTEALGVDDALLRLDDEGFPAWRLDLERSGGFNPLEVFALDLGGTAYLGATYWNDRSSSMDGVVLVDPGGDVALDATEGLFGANSMTPDPATPGNVLVSRYGDVFTTPVSLGSTRIEDGTELLARMTDLGSLITLKADTDSGRVVIAYENGVLQWHRPGGATEGPATCGAPCGAFHAATWDPGDPNAALAICNDAGDGRIRHVVRVPLDGSGCTVLFDGTFLDSARPNDLAIVE